ncbi:MAG: lamin tail domain-containing protein [Verrucomicrobia bacterium]|nr:lamin tail domain-containing protein [Verrucomicrobiota bacterium]
MGITAFAFFCFTAHGRGQLAITEVMSSGSKLNGSQLVTQGPDFFELTNFGDQEVDVTDYQIGDSQKIVPLFLDDSIRLTIGSKESVILIRTNAKTQMTVEQFRARWGGCLPSSVQVRIYDGPGISGSGDIVRLIDSEGVLVDRVEFGAAKPGVTFIYDTNSWDFGAFSGVGAADTCGAEHASELGSPGFARGPFPLTLIRDVADQDVCAGTPALLSVKAGGLPRPRYQWFFNDSPIDGATERELLLPRARLEDQGRYRVTVENGFLSMESRTATLTVSSRESLPVIVTPLTDFQVYTGQTARFSITVCAFPLPTYQWSSNNVEIPGATNPTVTIPVTSLKMSGIEFSVRVANSIGSLRTSAHLTVIPKPDLAITEIMGLPNLCGLHDEWFEVLNRGAAAVNLHGYRISDSPGFDGAFAIPDSPVLQPGEVMVFVKGMSPDQFRSWWGEENLPRGLQIATYRGFSVGGATPALYIWNGAADDPSDQVGWQSYAQDLQGLSHYFECATIADDADICLIGAVSAAGVAGGFRAKECGDIGSPGYLANPPPRFVDIRRENSLTTLRWRAVEGKNYALTYKDSLLDSNWKPLDNASATNSILAITDSKSGNRKQRFYRVQETP